MNFRVFVHTCLNSSCLSTDPELGRVSAQARLVQCTCTGAHELIKSMQFIKSFASRQLCCTNKIPTNGVVSNGCMCVQKSVVPCMCSHKKCGSKCMFRGRTSLHVEACNGVEPPMESSTTECLMTYSERMCIILPVP